jgi:hypothetical protein
MLGLLRPLQEYAGPSILIVGDLPFVSILVCVLQFMVRLSLYFSKCPTMMYGGVETWPHILILGTRSE